MRKAHLFSLIAHVSIFGAAYQYINRADGVGLNCFDCVVHVVGRRGWRRQMVDLIHFQEELNDFVRLLLLCGTLFTMPMTSDASTPRIGRIRTYLIDNVMIEQFKVVMVYPMFNISLSACEKVVCYDHLVTLQ